MSSNPGEVKLTFEPMRVKHVPLIGTVERRNYDFSWSDAIFRDCIKANYVCQLVKLDGELIGYGIMQIGADEAHILNLCIDKPWQRRGFARVLLEHLVQQAIARRAQMMFLEVRPSNPRAIVLYEQSGFNEIGLRKNYYDSHKGREDALVMARSLASSMKDFGRH